MGNGPSSRRNGRIQHNPVAPPPPPRMIPPPSGYPGTVGPPPYPPTYAPNGHHMPYLYPPNYNGPMSAPMGPPQFYQQGYIPATNGQYAMSLPPQGFGPAPHPPPRPHIPPEAQKANTIRNDVNLKKQSLRLEKDEENPGFHLVAFTFDATVAGSISVFFLAKEGDQCSLTPLKPHLYKAIRVPFEKGLGQKFRQAPGTGVNLALFDERELSKEGPDELYPLLVRAETVPKDPSANASLHEESPPGGPLPKYIHSQTTHAVIDKKDDGYKVKVVKQTIWVDGIRYDLQEIYGIENSGGGGSFDGSDAGKECVICMSEPRDTTVLPCRHMCMCSECAKVLRFQTNRCPICRTPVERLLEIKVPKNESLDIDSYIDRSSSFKGASASQSSSSNTQSANKDSGTMEIKVRSSSFKGASASQSSSSNSQSANNDLVALEMKD